VPPVATVELARSDVARVLADPARAALAADAINAFGLELYARIATEPGNLMISPASIAIALSMARAGARGTTADEMDRVLHDLGSDGLADAINALDAALAARTGTFKDSGGEDREVVLRIANALFPQRDMELETAFLEAMASRFGAGAWLVDYAADPEAARLAINAWVADQTEHRIPSILNPGDVTENWRLALANAIYLKAAWQRPFIEDATAPASFELADGSTVSVPTMRTSGVVGYGTGDDWAAVELPYVGGGLAMLIVVPDRLSSFEPGFDAGVLDAIVASLEGREVDLRLPRFDVESRADLAELLGALGMPTAFSDGADFSGITTAEALRIASVVHQANMTVDEKGTEAAAATVVGFDTTGGRPEPVELRVDRPFLVLLRDVPTGAVVFVGRVADPSETR
jgi:serpin B